MSATTLVFRLGIRTADNSSDLLVVTSVRGGTNPWIIAAPTGDGASFDPTSGSAQSAKYTIRVADGITSGTSRLFTSLLEDAGGQPQLTRLAAFIEWSLDGFTTVKCLIAGYLDTYQLSSDIAWDVTVVDFVALEHQIPAFAPHQVDGKLETLQAYLARWPYRGCIFGGPIRTPATDPTPRTFANIADRGGWMFTTSSAAPYQDKLTFQSGYQSPAYQTTRRLSDLADRANSAASQYFDDTGSNVEQFAEFQPNPDQINGFTGVIIQVGAQSGFTDAEDEFYSAEANNWFDPQSGATTAVLLNTNFQGSQNYCILTGPLATRLLDTTVRARCFTALPSDASPIYWDGHPVDLITTLGGEAGFAYVGATVEAVRAALGADLRIALRITATQNLGDFLEAAAYGPYGIGARQNADGNIELFTTRVLNSALPSVTITNQDIVRGSAKPYELDPSAAVKTVTFSAESWIQASVDTGTNLTNYPLDGVLIRPVTQQYVNADLGAPATDNEQDFNIPGMPHLAGTWAISWSHGASDWANAGAQEIFDRQGRGLLTTELVGVHGGSVECVQLGDEVLVALKQTPNQNKRLVDDPSVPGRCMQVVFIDPIPNATELHLVDCGPNAQPVATLPVLTIAAVSRRVASVTITNAAALNAAAIAVRLRMATTTGAAADAGAYAPVAYFPAGSVPTTAIALPAVTAGLTVFVEGRSEQAGARPSNYSAPVNVALSGLVAPSGVTASPDPRDGSHATLAWTLDASTLTDLVDVSLRLAAHTAAGNSPVMALPAGSITYTLEHLTPGTAYTAALAVRDAGSNDTSDPVEISFTTSGASVTLDTPTDANGFSGQQNSALGFPQQDGIYGLAVAAVDFPSFVEYVEQLETAPNSGTYGDPTTVATVPSVQGDWTLYESMAPSDGLRRILAARHVRDGATPSAYTAGVVVTPWTAEPLGLFSQTAGTNSIIRVSPSMSSDGLSKLFALVVGAKVDKILVHYRTVTIDATGDVYDFSGDEDVSVSPELQILVPADDAASFAISIPLRDFEVAGRIVPYVGLKEGPSVPFTVDAAPPAINAKLTGSRVNAIGAFTIGVAAGPSDWPVQVNAYLDTPTGETLVATTTLTAPATLDGTSFPGLSNIALPPGKDLVYLRVVLTDCSGQDWDFGPAPLGRVPLPGGVVTVGNYRAGPVFSISYTPDTTGLAYTAHNGKTKTWNSAALVAAGSLVTYTVGTTPLDDSSVEPALIVGETRSGAHVDFTGGGTTVSNVWAADLHGQPQNPPTVKVDVEPQGDGDTVNVYGTPDTQVDEALLINYRLGITDTALEYFMCASASDQTPLSVAAGTRIGPSNFFMRTDLVGSPAALLSGIALTHDQIDVQQMQSVGVDSGMPSAWTNVQLSLLPVPIIESLTLKFDPSAPNLLSAIINAGARCGSAEIEFADNESFSGATVVSGNVTDGNQLVLSITLSLSQLGKQWHARGTPYSSASLGGLQGTQVTAACAVPAVLGDPQISASENATTHTTTVTIAITDAGSYINNTWTDGTATGGLHAVLLALGVATEVSMTSHTLVGTLNTWTLAVAQDPLHPTEVKVYIHYLDGSEALILDTAVDSNKVSDVVNASAANQDASATLTVDWDTDTRIGSGCARYSVDGGSTWTTGTVSSALQTQFVITRTASLQTAIVQAQNAIDGAWGDQTPVPIDAYLSEGPSASAAYVRTNDTSGEIVWSCAQGTMTVSIDGGSFATPAASPIAITLDNHTHTYLFEAVNGGVTTPIPVSVPQLSASGTVYGTFSSLSATPDYGANTVTFDWGYSITPDNFYVRVVAVQSTGVTTPFLTTVSGSATSYAYTPPVTIVNSHSSDTITMTATIEPIISSTVGPSSLDIADTEYY